MNTERAISLLLRLGVAFAFLFPALNAFLDPYAWIGYFPPFLMGILPDELLLHGFGILEILLALWILSGRRIFIPSLVATVMLFAIVLFNLRDFQVLFRDIPIAFMALILTLQHRPHRS
jgi:uncharacterized membrane protein YphA (DoxX/SURF4 family)